MDQLILLGHQLKGWVNIIKVLPTVLVTLFFAAVLGFLDLGVLVLVLEWSLFIYLFFQTLHTTIMVFVVLGELKFDVIANHI